MTEEATIGARMEIADVTASHAGAEIIQRIAYQIFVIIIFIK